MLQIHLQRWSMHRSLQEGGKGLEEGLVMCKGCQGGCVEPWAFEDG